MSAIQPSDETVKIVSAPTQADEPPPELDEETLHGGLQALGARLRKAREEKGWSLEACHKQCRIRDTHLASLERGDVDALPGLTFAIGFMRVYSRHLGLPEQQMVKAFSQALNQRDEKLVTQYFPPPDSQSRGRPGLWLIAAGVLLLVGLYVGYEYWFSEQPQMADPIASPMAQPVGAQPADASASAGEEAPNGSSEAGAESSFSAAGEEGMSAPEAASESMESESSDQAQMEQPTPEPTPLTQQADREPMTQTPLREEPLQTAHAAPPSVVKPDLNAEVAVVAHAAQPEPEIPPMSVARAPEAAPSAPAEPTQPESTPTPTPDRAATPEPLSEEARPLTDSRVALVINENAWLLIKDGRGKTYKTGLYKAGRVIAIPTLGGPYVAKIGNAGGVSFLVDGQPAPPLGKPGQLIRKVTLSPAMIAARRRMESR
ncbi:helix-turn-helix domain-containing protein [Magnetofaba australis]|uniref:Putative Cytoskeleton protein rodZ n=1 Tax=Magnetofaba australis IT-1 TaxID=1434232 RepID=A0A1Y2K2H2_9PROT|nr:helix-turn-helix domain-containing protein [Magnetofaba australis]OSM01384.1 putative Cytoskeleton protein rodZ [Magnetofaba australis IT-1]